MREKREEALGMVLDLALEAREKIVADLHAAGCRIGGGLVDDGADAAEVDVAVVGDKLERRWRQIYGQLLLQHRLVAAKEIPQRGIARHDAQRSRAFFNARDFPQRDSQLLLAHGLGVLVGRKLAFRAARRQRNGDRLKARAAIY